MIFFVMLDANKVDGCGGDCDILVVSPPPTPTPSPVPPPVIELLKPSSLPLPGGGTSGRTSGFNPNKCEWPQFYNTPECTRETPPDFDEQQYQKDLDDLMRRMLKLKYMLEC